MLYNSIIIINATETENSTNATAYIFIILKYYGLPKYQNKDQSAAYYSCEKTRLAVYITSRITPRGVKLEVIYRTNQIYSRLGTHSPAAVHRHRLDKCDIDRN